MAEYDLDGWRVPGPSDPGELSYHVMRGASWRRYLAAHAKVRGTTRHAVYR